MSSAPSSQARGVPNRRASSASGRTASTPMKISLQAQPDVDLPTPAQVTRALGGARPRAQARSHYALAHANAAMCHHCLYLRSGLREEDRLASVRFARTRPIAHGRDDARALTLAGFSNPNGRARSGRPPSSRWRRRLQSAHQRRCSTFSAASCGPAGGKPAAPSSGANAACA